MLITFKGEGCYNCPFYQVVLDKYEHIDGEECVLHKYKKGLSQLYMIGNTRPDDCPLKGFRGSIELQVEEPK